MAIRIKTIKKRRYAYDQHSYRVGGKVKTRSIYLGAVDWGAVFRRPRGMITPAMEEKMLVAVKAQEARQAAKVAALEKALGVKLPAHDVKPIEKPTPAASSLMAGSASSSAAAATSEPAPADAQAPGDAPSPDALS